MLEAYCQNRIRSVSHGDGAQSQLAAGVVQAPCNLIDVINTFLQVFEHDRYDQSPGRRIYD